MSEKAFSSVCSGAMSESLREQLRALLTSLLAGAGAGLLFDLILSGRRSGRVQRLLSALVFLTLSFGWLWAAGLLAGGSAPGFLFGAAAGACLYFALIHREVRSFIRFFRYTIQKMRKKSQDGSKKGKKTKKDGRLEKK